MKQARRWRGSEDEDERKGVGASSCTTCGEGKYTENPSEPCKNCALGRFRKDSDDDATRCNNCSAGFFQEDTGQSRCLICPSGYIAASHSKVHCTKCDPGQTTNGVTGETQCTDCLAGRYSNNPELRNVQSAISANILMPRRAQAA